MEGRRRWRRWARRVGEVQPSRPWPRDGAVWGTRSGGIRSPLVPLGLDFHGRVEGALQQARCIEAPDAGVAGSSWLGLPGAVGGGTSDEAALAMAIGIPPPPADRPKLKPDEKVMDGFPVT